MKSPAHRYVVLAEAWLLLAPTTVLAMVAVLLAVLFMMGGGGLASLVTLVHGVLALLALSATWIAVGVFRVEGTDGLKALPPLVVLAMGTGIVLVALGALASVVFSFVPQLDTGTMAGNALGVLAVVPCAHLLVLRAQALRTSSPDSSPATAVPRRTWPALATLAAVLVALQWLVTGPLPFDHSRWIAHDEQPDMLRQRHRMADWLLLDGSLMGLRREEVVALLGEPLRDGWEGGSMTYLLGDARGVDACCYELLSLTLDARQRVVEASTYADD